MFKLIMYIYSVPTNFKSMSEENVEYSDAPEMSQEEMDAKRQQLDQFYDEAIPHLEKQLRYEELRASIETARFKTLQAQIAVANMLAPEMEEDDEDLEPPRRTLRRDK